MKPADCNDPMELVGVGLPAADADAMARCLIEEYLLLGWDERQLLLLFTRPCFRATHAILRERGEAYVRGLIEEARRAWRAGACDGGASHA